MSVSKRFTDKKLTVTFYIKREAAQGASRIELLCEHNGWMPVAMKPQKNGTFRGSITIPRDGQLSYQYRFKLLMSDGSEKFDNDWDADGYIANPFGGENSYFTTEPKKK